MTTQIPAHCTCTPDLWSLKQQLVWAAQQLAGKAPQPVLDHVNTAINNLVELELPV